MSRDEFCFQFPDDIEPTQSSQSRCVARLARHRQAERWDAPRTWSTHGSSPQGKRPWPWRKITWSRKAVKNRLSRAHRWAAQRCLMSESPFARVASPEGH